MTTPKHAARMLNDLNQWAPLLTDTTTTLISPRNTGTPTHTTGGHRDLADLIAPTLDAPDQGAPALRTHAQITEWATIWCKVADLHNYTGSPLLALANNTPQLSETWDDWDAFTQDLHTLHHRTATLAGHAPRTIALCSTPNCNGTIIATTTKHGLAEFAWCNKCETLYHTEKEAYAEDLLNNAQLETIAPTAVTASQAIKIWQHQITADNIKKWTQWGKLIKCTSHPTTYNLKRINQLAANLIRERQRREKPQNDSDRTTN